MQKNILVVTYHGSLLTLPQTTIDSFECFRHAEDSSVFFCNAHARTPDYLLKIAFDLVVFHVTFTGTLRWNLQEYDDFIRPFLKFREIKGRKVIIAQDEFLNPKKLCRFINDFDIWGVFSVAEMTEWSKIYKEVDFSKVKFFQVLTGYLSENLLSLLKQLEQEKIQRDIDIGYRAWKAEYWVGRHGFLKQQIADSFIARTKCMPSLNIDISTDPKKTFYGCDWYKFLLRCRFVIGVEGGSSLLDWDGSIRQAVQSYLKLKPQASFEECESACFAGLDGKLSLFAISPRHLEACATKTCQILLEGSYTGVLQPWRHYIPIKRDLSNISEVLELCKDESLRLSIVESAYEDIIVKDNYTFKRYVKNMIENSLQGTIITPKNFQDKLLYYYNCLSERGSRFNADLRERTKKILPKPLLNGLIKIKHILD